MADTWLNLASAVMSALLPEPGRPSQLRAAEAGSLASCNPAWLGLYREFAWHLAAPEADCSPDEQVALTTTSVAVIITNHSLAPPLVCLTWPPMLPYSARRPRYTGPGPRAAAVWWRATPPSPLSGRDSLPSVSGSAPPTSQSHLALFYYHETFPTDDIKILDTFCLNLI